MQHLSISAIYYLDMFKMILGIITIIGACGFFVTTSPRLDHWPIIIRRSFIAVFILCNITSQLFFNVLNIPNNKYALALLTKLARTIFEGQKYSLQTE